jgi:hypothetical protein
MTQIAKIPTLAELHHKPEEAFKSDALNALLNQQPPAAWVKQHPFAKSVTYLPIDKVEFLLTRIFQQWRVEVLSTSQLFNSVAVTVRLHYLNPTTGQWQYHDGVGAVGVQTNAGASASDLSAIKQDAIMKALPAAKSYAVKDAAENLGSIFGANLNRKDIVPFSGAYTPQEAVIKQRALAWLNSGNATPEQVKEWFEKSDLKTDEEIIELVNKIIL